MQVWVSILHISNQFGYLPLPELPGPPIQIIFYWPPHSPPPPTLLGLEFIPKS